ncbi:MAG: apolipoprotein N-acyltransferase [Planctomycetes bacterium]|nr:apolipoprotein N-acyltransferase [Planctomycetota bacterium]
MLPMQSRAYEHPRWHTTAWPGVAILAALTAGLLWLSFPRPDVWPLAHVSLVPLTLAALRARRTRSLILITYLTGFVWWLVAIAWMIPVTAPGYACLSAYKALYFVAFVLIVRSIASRRRWPLALVVPVVWVGLEYMRGVFLSGFPWFELGHSQPTIMIQIADTIGAYGVSFLTAMTSGLLADLLTRPLFEAHGKQWGAPLRFSLPFWTLAMAVTLVYGQWRMNQPIDVGHTIRVTVVQTNIPQSNKESPTDEQDWANFQSMLQMSDQALADKPDLIVWPETMVPRAINDESVDLFRRLNPPMAVYHDELLAWVARTGVPLMVGAHGMDDWPPYNPATPVFRPHRRYNSAYLIEPPGRIAGRYDKIHRVPFGEYIPWVESIPPLKDLLLRLTPYQTDYTLRAGTEATVFHVKAADGRAWGISTPICFEDVISDVPREMVYGGGGAKRVDLLVNLTNDGWFAGTAQCPQHEQIARFRCVENRVSEARSVNTGVSSFIDSCGRIIARVIVDGRTQQVAGYATHDLTLDSRTTIYSVVGDTVGVVCFVGTAIMAVLGLAQFFWRKGHT